MLSVSRIRLIACVAVVCQVHCVFAQSSGSLSDFSGAHTRVVWVQDQGPTNSDTLAMGQRLRLMGLDSEDERGERAILGELRNYAKPLLLADGQRVVYSDQTTQKFYVVNWDGTGKKLLGDGLAVDTWRDPKDGVDWIYAAKRVGKPENVTYRNLRRVKLSDPKVSQKVWDQTEVGCDNFQLAADGIQAAGEFPWPNGGVANLSTRKWKKLNEGCWASIAPDNSGVSWVFDGPHRNLQFHRPDQTESWKVNVNSAPGIQGAEVFHPRWSNHAQYFAMTGPYSVKGAFNVISGGGPQVEVYVGRFNADFQSVEAWQQVTHNARGDFYPDVWIAGGELTKVVLPGLQQPGSPAVAAKWPAVTGGLLFAWNNSAQTNQLPAAMGRPERACQVVLHGQAFPGRFHDMHLQGGTATLQDFGPQLLAACQMQRQVTLSFLVTPSNLLQTDATLVQLGLDSQSMFRLSQDGVHLRWKVGQIEGRTEQPVWLNLQPVHVAATLAAKSFQLFADGKLVLSKPVDVRFADWKSAEVALGGNRWQGAIEAVAVYSKGLTAAEVEQQSIATRKRLAERRPLRRYAVEAKCLERSTVLTAQQILPYRRALAIHEFEVVKVLASSAPTDAAHSQTSGDLVTKAHIMVASWVILDGKTLPGAERPAVEETVQLTLEAMEGHPELTGERQIQDLEALDLQLYYDVTGLQSMPAGRS